MPRSAAGRSPASCHVADLADSLTTDELLEALGRSWTDMTSAERDACGPTPKPPAVPRASLARRYPALALWRAELAAGVRRPKDCDALRDAAGWESAAFQIEADGMGPSWTRYMESARQAIADAMDKRGRLAEPLTGAAYRAALAARARVSLRVAS